jgi:two-component system, LytTR family, sensor histidine kinase AlgZ
MQPAQAGRGGRFGTHQMSTYEYRACVEPGIGHSMGTRASRFRSRLAWPLRAALLNFIGACAVPLLIWSFAPGSGWRRLAVQFGYSLIYANCIGSILSATMPVTFHRTEAWPDAKKWLARLGVVVGVTTVGSMLAGLIMRMLIKDYNYWSELWVSSKISLILALTVTAFVSTYQIYKAKLEASAVQLKTKELERERALKLATEARLSSLESRLQPHFLFNTINSVSSLIHEDPVRAEQLLSRMAALLRFSLDSTRAGLVLLEQELRVVKDYLEIEKTRFEDRLRYEIDVPESLLGAAVPPLAIQSLVENSVKYAVAPRRQGASVQVRVRQQNDVLIVSVIDDGPGFDTSSLIAGHGIDHLQERLAALFKDAAQLEIIGVPGNTEVRLSMPMLAGQSTTAQNDAAGSPALSIGPR